MAYAMRRCGKSYMGLKLFASLVALPSPMSNSSYNKLVQTIHRAVKDVAFEIMEDAAAEVHEIDASTRTEDEIVDTGVSCDGTWQKRGFTSLNGAVAEISIKTGRILDVEIRSRYCNTCTNYLNATNFRGY